MNLKKKSNELYIWCFYFQHWISKDKMAELTHLCKRQYVWREKNVAYLFKKKTSEFKGITRLKVELLKTSQLSQFLKSFFSRNYSDNSHQNKWLWTINDLEISYQNVILFSFTKTMVPDVTFLTRKPYFLSHIPWPGSLPHHPRPLVSCAILITTRKQCPKWDVDFLVILVQWWAAHTIKTRSVGIDWMEGWIRGKERESRRKASCIIYVLSYIFREGDVSLAKKKSLCVYVRVCIYIYKISLMNCSLKSSKQWNALQIKIHIGQNLVFFLMIQKTFQNLTILILNINHHYMLSIEGSSINMISVIMFVKIFHIKFAH